MRSCAHTNTHTPTHPHTHTQTHTHTHSLSRRAGPRAARRARQHEAQQRSARVEVESLNYLARRIQQDAYRRNRVRQRGGVEARNQCMQRAEGMGCRADLIRARIATCNNMQLATCAGRRTARIQLLCFPPLIALVAVPLGDEVPSAQAEEGRGVVQGGAPFAPSRVRITGSRPIIQYARQARIGTGQLGLGLAVAPMG